MNILSLVLSTISAMSANEIVLTSSLSRKDSVLCANMLTKKIPRPPKTEKQLVFEEDNKGDNLLDESQLRE